MEHPLIDPPFVGGPHKFTGVSPAHTLPALRGVAYECDVELEVMEVGSHPEESPASDGVAEGHEQAGQYRHRVSFGVRLDLGDDVAR